MIATDLVQDWLTLPEVADRLGTDINKVRQMLADRRLLTVRCGEPPAPHVPEAFLVPGHLANPAAPSHAPDLPEWTVLASLQGTFTVLGDGGFTDDEAIVWLFTPDDSLGGTPMAALRAGRKSEVRRRAQSEL